jgi:hypothetical protein
MSGENWSKVHSPLHAFCRGRGQVYTLDILLDIEKLYPLISRPQAEGGNVSPENFFRNKMRGGFQ